MASQRLGRFAGVVLLVSGLVAAAVASVSWWIGGGQLRLGPLSLSVQRPFRALAVALSLLLLREALRRASSWPARLRFLALLAAFFIALTLDSSPRLVGDGQEYVAMAWNLAHGRPPALDAAERATLERALSLRAGELGEGRDVLVGADGRQDFYHFWLYSLVVAPFLATASALGASPLVGFTVANALLLLTAAFCLERRIGPAATLVLCWGPLVWWLDKPHAEVFLVALLALAFAARASHPERALPLVGLAAAQNPAFLALLAIGSLAAIARRWRRPFLVPALALAWALAALHPLYYLWHLGRTSPLRDTVLRHVPNVAELRALVVDPNLGLVPAWPALGLAAVLALVFSLRAHALRGSWRVLAAHALALGTLLVLFTQPGNINHGGTRGMSRYALWLVPFVVPALARLAALGRQHWLTALAALSLLSAIPEYLPGRPERYLEPTPLALWLWTRHPGFDRPLPEVFAERAWGYPPLGGVPASTPRCETALVRGDGDAVGQWPLSCAPAEKPAACREAGALCYAWRRAGGGYAFAAAPVQPTFLDREASRWYWSGAPSPQLRAELRSLPWKDYGLVAPDDEAVFVAARRGSGKLQVRAAEGGYLVWIDGVRRAGAWLAVVARPPSTALLVDPASGAEVQRSHLEAGTPARIDLPERAPLLLVVAVSATR